MTTKKTCNRGCGSEALFICTGFDYDPRVKGGRGKPFKEPCCRSFASYLSEASAELDSLFTMERIVNVPD